MTETPNLNLEKPNRDDFYDVEVFNRNADRIDGAFNGVTKITVATSEPDTLEDGEICFVVEG